jgi:polyphosphate kinase
MFPVEAPELRARLLNEVLALQLQDNVKAHRLTADGSYVRVATGDTPVRSQLMLLDVARRAAAAPIRVVEPVLRHAAAPEAVGESLRAAAG